MPNAGLYHAPKRSSASRPSGTIFGRLVDPEVVSISATSAASSGGSGLAPVSGLGATRAAGAARREDVDAAGLGEEVREQAVGEGRGGQQHGYPAEQAGQYEGHRRRGLVGEDTHRLAGGQGQPGQALLFPSGPFVQLAVAGRLPVEEQGGGVGPLAHLPQEAVGQCLGDHGRLRHRLPLGRTRSSRP